MTGERRDIIQICLQPANSSMQPIYVKDASVLGVVVGVVRNMI